jgi:hypothetical protein
MSILVVEVVARGLLFAADRNVTVTDRGGTTSQPIQQAKVLRWPRDDVLFGYVGAATAFPGYPRGATVPKGIRPPFAPLPGRAAPPPPPRSGGT